MTGWVWIQTNYCTVGVEVKEGIVVESANIVKWMNGKALIDVLRWKRIEKYNVFKEG